MESWKGTALVVAMVLLAGGCQTSKRYTDWQEISAAESALTVSAFNSPDAPSVTRHKRTETNFSGFNELWLWEGGAIAVYLIYPGWFYTTRYGTADTLMDGYQTWNRLKKIGFSIRRSDIKISHQGRQSFPYAIGLSSDKATMCFVAESGAGTKTGSPRGATQTKGRIELYMCANTADSNREDFEALCLEFIKGIYLKE